MSSVGLRVPAAIATDSSRSSASRRVVTRSEQSLAARQPSASGEPKCATSSSRHRKSSTVSASCCRAPRCCAASWLAGAGSRSRVRGLRAVLANGAVDASSAGASSKRAAAGSSTRGSTAQGAAADTNDLRALAKQMRFRARSDGKGAFAIRGLLPGRYRVFAEKRGLIADEAKLVDVTIAGQGPQLRLRLVRSGRAFVKAIDLDGSAIARGRLRVLDSQGRQVGSSKSLMAVMASLFAGKSKDGDGSWMDMGELRPRYIHPRSDSAARGWQEASSQDDSQAGRGGDRALGSAASRTRQGRALSAAIPSATRSFRYSGGSNASKPGFSTLSYFSRHPVGQASMAFMPKSWRARSTRPRRSGCSTS